MNGNNPSEHGLPPQDDSYWSSLFQQEEKVTPPPKRDVDVETWSPLNQRIDGRFRWSDGGKTDQEDPWQLANELVDSDQVLQLKVTGFNKGGLLVHWNGIQGFVPASQLIDFPQFHVERERMNALESWVTRSLRLKVIEVNRDTNRLILSERAALVRTETRTSLMDQIESGDHVVGHVTNLTKFGAFVDLGGVEGLIHISELSWSRVTHPSDIVAPNERIEALVLNVDRSKGRIALSLKRMRRDPWRTAETRYRPGMLVEGVVSNVVSYGAFVQIEEELEGLIHISELAEGTFLHPRNVVRRGENVVARVLHVDGQGKRLALTLRGTGQNSQPEYDDGEY